MNKLYLSLALTIFTSFLFAQSPADEDFQDDAPTNNQALSLTNDGVVYFEDGVVIDGNYIEILEASSYGMAFPAGTKAIAYNVGQGSGGTYYGFRSQGGAEFRLASLVIDVVGDVSGGGFASQYIVRGYRNGVEQVTETVDFPTSATYGSVTYTRNVNYYLGGTLNFSSTAEWKNIDEVRFYWNDNFGMVGTLKSIDFEPAITGTLPVKLLDYKADIQPNGFVKVQWSTTQENNNSHFLIERSVSNSNFTVIGRVEAKGAEANHNDYSFIDEQPVAGTAYYRLIQYDLDGRSESYKILAVEKPLKTLLSIYPNPVTGNGFTVTLGGVITTPVRYTLSNIAGKMISQGTISSQQQFIPLSSALPGGTYILSTSDGQRIKLLRR